MFKRLAVGLTAVVTAVVGLTVTTAVPAAAEVIPERGRWVAHGEIDPVRGPSVWRCTGPVAFDTGVTARVCAIRTPDGTRVQGAVVIRNNRPGLYGAEVAFRLRTYIGLFKWRWSCPRSGVASGTWSVCYGRTFPFEPDVWVYEAGANGQSLPESPSV